MKHTPRSGSKSRTMENITPRNVTLAERRPRFRKLPGLALGIAGVAALVVAANPAWLSSPPTVSQAIAAPLPTTAGSLSSPDGEFDFGAVSMRGGKVKHRYSFRNGGDSPVTIERIYTSCMCTTATFMKGPRIVGSYGMPGHGPLPAVNEILAPCETAYIDATFDPAAHGPAGLGHTVREITVEQSGAVPLKLGFSADVRP